MIDTDTEHKFRLYLEIIGEREAQNRATNRPDPISFLAGGSMRTEYEQIWARVIADPDIQKIIHQMLFIPSQVPDYSQGVTLLAIIDHLQGKFSGVQLYNDLIVTEAEITRVTVLEDDEGPTYIVTYVFTTGHPFPRGNGQYTFTKEFGYDITHAAWNGWGRKQLDTYWNIGHRVRCHYSAGDPLDHYICAP